LTIPPSHPGSTRRDALTTRLIAMRTTAGLSGNALAKRLGTHQSRVWKIEHGDLLPSEDNIRAWARETGNEQETDSLMESLAEARREQAFSAVIRKSGPAAYQDQVGDLETRYDRVGEFSVGPVPGFLQTPPYARSLFTMPAGPRAWGADDAAIENAVDARMRRQEILYDPGKRIQVVLGEGALRTLVAPPAVLAGQLEKLMAVARLPSVEIGVIGFGQRMPVFPLGFRVYGNDLVISESLAAERIFAAAKEPDEVAAFLEAFNELRQAASTGAEAEAIIQRALDDLRAMR
jgi:transcriptional regulator with XRE-family HTH domain